MTVVAVRAAGATKSMLHSLSLKQCPPRKIPHSFGFTTKPDLVYAARLAAARRLSYSCIDIWNQLARWQPWSLLILSKNQKDWEPER